ncbi:MAG: DUF485 domain-containing protein [Bacteroidales bacterium]|nr:DUF485 domain-containing protein [Bacteroidales bacterium]
MLHGPAVKLDEDKASKKKASLGVKLFFVYLLFYAAFTYISISHPSWMSTRIIFGLNLAIVYGFSLIIIAIVMGWVYHMICSRYERQMNKED